MSTARTRTADKPASVGLNLDTLRREGARLEPFLAVHEGKRYEFSDPGEMDWQELASVLNDPRLLFRLGLADEDYQALMRAKIPTWKVNALVKAWQLHYGIDEESVGNGRASTI